MYNNVLQMMIHAAGTFGPLATETCDGEVLRCRWIYGHPHEWTINGSPVTETDAALWMLATHQRRKEIWGIP
jgi:hypothetical protein